MTPIPPALATAYAERVTLTAPELCRLLPMESKTLRGHISRGHIEFVEIGVGDACPRRAFTLAQVMQFLQGRSFRAAPPTGHRELLSAAAYAGDGERDFQAFLALKPKGPPRSRSGPSAINERDSVPGGFLARLELERAAKAAESTVPAAEQTPSARTLRQHQAAERRERVAERTAGKAKSPA